MPNIAYSTKGHPTQSPTHFPVVTPFLIPSFRLFLYDPNEAL